MSYNNVFLGTTSNLSVNSITLGNLDPNENVISDSQGKLISAMIPITPSNTFQEVYDASLSQPQILTDITNSGLAIREGFNDFNNTLLVTNTSGSPTTTIEGGGTLTTITGKMQGLIMTGGTDNSIQLEKLTPSQIDILDTNLGLIADKAVLAYNTGSKKIDIIDNNIVQRGQQNVHGANLYDWRYAVELVPTDTNCLKFFSPHSCEVNQIRLWSISQGSGDIRVAIYDDVANQKIGESNLQPPLITNDFMTLSFPASVTLEVGKAYWVCLSTGAGTPWEILHSTNLGSVDYDSSKISFSSNADYSAGFPVTVPLVTSSDPKRYAYHLLGNFTG